MLNASEFLRLVLYCMLQVAIISLARRLVLYWMPHEFEVR